MENCVENKAMNKLNTWVFKAGKVLLVLAITAFAAVLPGTVTAKSLYVLSDIDAAPCKLRAYDIAANGTLTFQEQYSIPRYNLGAFAVALDSDSGYLFVTYVYSNYIVMIDSKKMVPEQELVVVPGAWNPSGIVFDNKKKQLYCVDKGRSFLWVYNWDATNASLTLVEGAPFSLKNASAHGIALDEVNRLLYVTNSTNKVYAYSTIDWSLKRTISLNRVAENIAVDAKGGFIYTGGSYAGNPYLTQYNLKTNSQLDTIVEPNAVAGVMGVAVDPNTGKVYITTGNYVYPGGDNIRIYDKYLHPKGVVSNIGNPTGLVIPIKEVGYNPLNLSKKVVSVVNSDGSTPSESVNAGNLVTYQIAFDNKKNDYTVTNVQVDDLLPDEVSFVSASDDEVFGHYDPFTHKYTWIYPSLVKGSSAFLDITVKIDEGVLPKTTITNTVTIKSDTTPPVTRRADIITASKPLNIKKTVFGGAEGLPKWVDPNEVITYNIYLNNNDNNFPATDVIVTDTLPADEIFLTADDEDVFGVYDEDLHTFTWSIPSLASKEAVNLMITVKLADNVPEGETLTNTVTAQSNETTLSSSSADIKVGEGPVVIEGENIQVIPDTVRRNANISGIMCILKMPLGYTTADIKNSPLILSLANAPGGVSVTANSDQVVTKYLGSAYVVTVFDKRKVMDAIPGYGKKNIIVQGYLTNGTVFQGYATLTITE